MTNERSQGRAEHEAQRRRRRGDSELRADAKLPIPPEVQARLDAEGLVPRWVNDEGNRMHRMTVQDDYDKVAGVEPVPVGTDKAGNPIMAHLVAKRRDFIEEDRAKADERLRATEAGLFRKPEDVDAASKAANPNPASAERYVDASSNLNRNTRRNNILGD
jgi:hypothetical protein